MPKAGFIVARVSFVVLAASMLGVGMLAAPAVGQTSTCTSSNKCFFAVNPVLPSSTAAGVSTSFTFTIQNEAMPQQLGAVQISAPANFMITGASIVSGAPAGTASFTSSSGLFINLNLAPSASTTLTVTATVSSCSASSYQWGMEAKQSNNFNGTGNDFQLDPRSAGNLSGALVSCSLPLQPCPVTCSSSASSATMSVTVTTSSAQQDDSIATAFEGASINYSCPTYTSLPDIFGFAVFNKSGVPEPTILLNVTVRIDKSAVNMSGHPGASSWQICYASTTLFTALPGTFQQNVTIGGNSNYFTGLLPDCSSSQGAPCVQSRNKNNAGDEIVTFLAFGDPYGHP
jgi:hypothetical protein